MRDEHAVASDARPLWQGFEEGVLRLPFCSDCGAAHLPPGPVCPYCLSDVLVWRPASGRAVLSTWVVERQKSFAAFDPPYILGEVQLEEGPRMPVSIEFADLEQLRLDARGSITFARAPNGLNLPHFFLADAV